MQFNKSAFWKSRNIIRYQQKGYASKTLLQLVKSEIIMLIESTPRKPIDTRIFVNELNEVVEFIKGALATILIKKLYVLEIGK